MVRRSKTMYTTQRPQSGSHETVKSKPRKSKSWEKNAWTQWQWTFVHFGGLSEKSNLHHPVPSSAYRCPKQESALKHTTKVANAPSAIQYGTGWPQEFNSTPRSKSSAVECRNGRGTCLQARCWHALSISDHLLHAPWLCLKCQFSCGWRCELHKLHLEHGIVEHRPQETCCAEAREAWNRSLPLLSVPSLQSHSYVRLCDL